MTLNEIMDTIRPVATHAGVATLSGAATYVGVAGVRAMGAGTDFKEQIYNGTNVVVGVAAAATAFVLLKDAGFDHNALLPHITQYVGAGTAGVIAGAVVRPVVNALRSHDSVFQRMGERAREGAVRGAVICPVAYGLMDALAHYFR
jgi:hypothetical protein